MNEKDLNGLKLIDDARLKRYITRRRRVGEFLVRQKLSKLSRLQRMMKKGNVLFKVSPYEFVSGRKHGEQLTRQQISALKRKLYHRLDNLTGLYQIRSLKPKNKKRMSVMTPQSKLKGDSLVTVYDRLNGIVEHRRKQSVNEKRLLEGFSVRQRGRGVTRKLKQSAISKRPLEILSQLRDIKTKRKGLSRVHSNARYRLNRDDYVKSGNRKKNDAPEEHFGRYESNKKKDFAKLFMEPLPEDKPKRSGVLPSYSLRGFDDLELDVKSFRDKPFLYSDRIKRLFGLIDASLYSGLLDKISILEYGHSLNGLLEHNKLVRGAVGGGNNNNDVANNTATYRPTLMNLN